MRILVLSQKIPYPPKDGGAIAILELATGLVKSGNQVTMLAYNPRKHFISLSDIPKKLRSEINFLPVNVDTPVKVIPALKNLLFSRKPYIAERFYSIEYLNELRNSISRTQFDIVQIEGPYLAQYIPFIRKYSNAKIVIRMHNIEHEIWQRQSKNCKNLLKKLYLQNLANRVKKYEYKSLRSANAILPITKRDETIVREKIPEIQCKVIPTGLNKFPGKNPNIKPASELFFIGSLEWFPNQEGLYWFFEKCWPLVIKKEKAILNIAGRNAPSDFVNYLKSQNIRYHGEVPHAIRYMEKFSIMIVPLLSGSGMRIKIVEAMAAGKCVVTTGIGIEGIDAEHKKHLFIANNPEDFATWCNRLLEDPSLTNAIAENAKGYARKHFDNNKITDNLHTFYKTLVSV